jgi:hypothetical protein
MDKSLFILNIMDAAQKRKRKKYGMFHCSMDGWGPGGSFHQLSKNCQCQYDPFGQRHRFLVQEHQDKG